MQSSDSVQSVISTIDEILNSTHSILKTHLHIDDNALSNITVKAKWGTTYTLDQFMEHAIIHVLWHIRQLRILIEKI